MNIYFHIDELKRDAVVASALQKKFAKKGHKLVYGNRVSNRLLKYFHSAFDVIIVPRPHVLNDCWGDSWMKWDSRFVMLSSESLGIICKDHHVMARTLLEKDFFEEKKEYVDRIDAFCLWGTKQLQAVKEHAGEIVEKCHVVGHPRHDKNCLSRASVNQSKKKTIGVITRSVVLNDYFGRSALDTFTTLFDDHFQYEYFNKKTGDKLISKRPGVRPADAVIVQAIDTENTLKVLRALVKDGYHVSVRVHPKENQDTWERLLTHSGIDAQIADSKLPIAHWLVNFDYVVGPPSTSFYDAVMLGITPICINNLDPRRKDSIDELWEDNNNLMPFLYKPESLEHLLDYIKNGSSNIVSKEILDVLSEEADFPLCTTSLDQVVEICLRCVKLDKKRKVFLSGFLFASTLFMIVWRKKNRLINRNENSAMFSIGKKEVQFIDSLT